MGGMLSIVKVRKDQPPGDYSDPGWYEHPEGTVSFEYVGEVPAVSRSSGTSGQSMPRSKPNDPNSEVSITSIEPLSQASRALPRMRARSQWSNIRSKPSNKSNILHSIPQGETVSVIKRSGNWMEISSRGVIGYISANLLENL